MKNQSKKSSKDPNYIKDKPLHLIIDGPDGVGKSTVCQMMSTVLGIPVIKMKNMPDYFYDDPEAASKIYNETVIQFNDTSFIQDRGWPTSVVYSVAYNRPEYKTKYLNDVKGKLNEHIFILIRESPFREDKYVSTDKWEFINDLFRLFTSPDARVDIIDVGTKTPERICKEIIRLLQEQASQD